MSDIVERLDGTQSMTGSLEEMMRESSAEVRKLREELQGALSACGNYSKEIERLRTLVGLADDLRRAQQAYMADRGNNEKGRSVGVAADLYDRVRALKDTKP